MDGKKRKRATSSHDADGDRRERVGMTTRCRPEPDVDHEKPLFMGEVQRDFEGCLPPFIFRHDFPNPSIKMYLFLKKREMADR